ncbi:MAG: hypothetical protein EPO02_13310 [Nitrospirae bacterium]|nr:MAG: hypothetical protein EPO02_13310 [Nitrospirota bacterium]
MIRGHVAMVRQIRSFLERSHVPFSDIQFIYEKDDENRIILDEQFAEASFRVGGHVFEVAVRAPTEDGVEGIDPLPLGRIAVRLAGGRVLVKGPIDTSTWDEVEKIINTYRS